MSEQLKELRDIKKLLILLAVKKEVSVNEIARTLGVDQSAISHLLNPKKKSRQRGEKDSKEAKDS
jgi:DNA-binding transcriptional ArsR family regulator